MSCSSSSSPHQHSPTHSPKTSSSPKSSQSPPDTVSHSTSRRRLRYDLVKLLKAIAAFRFRSGVMPTRSKCLPDFLKEVKEFVPDGLTDKQLYRLESEFRNCPVPGPNSSEFDRYLYELGVKAWGPRRWISSGNPRRRRGSGRKNIKESENELVEDGYVDLLEEDEGESPYKYLKHALEDFWIGKNLDLNVLKLALQKVDSAEAKRLDKQFMEIAKDELKLKIEKNRLSNDIIHIVCSGLRR